MLKPATKYLGNTEDLQIKHMRSELMEIEKAFYICLHDNQGDNDDIDKKNKEDLIMEVVDLQMSCETMLAILGLDEDQRNDARKKVVCKNFARGYYNK